MKAKHLNPFVTAAKSVLGQFFPDAQFERGELEVIDQPGNPRSVAVLIGISGDLEGRVIYEMHKETAVDLAAEMNGEDIPGFNEMVRSTIQELGNIVSGNAAQELESTENELSISITPPSLIVGEDTQISDSVSQSYIQVPLLTNDNEILINLSVRES